MKTENDRPLPPNAPEEEWEFGEHTTCPECGTDCYALWEQQNRKAPLPPPQARTPPRAEINKWLDTRDDPFKILAQMRIVGNLAMVLEEWQKHLGVGAESAPQEAPLEIINRWISQVENPDFGSVPSKKTLLELLGYVREEIAASKMNGENREH